MCALTAASSRRGMSPDRNLSIVKLSGHLSLRIEEKLSRNGFRVVFSSSFTALLLPLMAASRLRGDKRSDEDVYEFKVNPAINRVFLETLYAEVRMTLAGVGWPAGGSRVVVAIGPGLVHAFIHSAVLPANQRVAAALSQRSRLERP